MYVEPASAQAIALRREGARHVLQPRGRSCRVAPATTDAHRSAWRLIGSSRVRPRRRSGNNAPGGNAARTGPGRATYAQCNLHCVALRTMSGRWAMHGAVGDARSGGRCTGRRAIHGAAGDAKGRQAMHGVADDARNGGRCTGAAGDAKGLRTMHGAADDARSGRRCTGRRAMLGEWRAMHGGGGRRTEWRAMHGVAGDARAAAMHGAAGDVRSGGRFKEAADGAKERRTMHCECRAIHGDGVRCTEGGRCMERRAMHGVACDARSGRQCTEPTYDAQGRWPCASPARRQMRGKPRQTARRRY